MTQPDTQSFELPVTQIWREAYGFVFSMPMRVLIAAIVPFGLYFLISTAIQITFLNATALEFLAASAALETIDFESADTDFSVFGSFFGVSLQYFAWIAVLLVFGGLAGASMAAAWHRTTLIGLDAPRTGFGLFLGAAEFRYFFRALTMVFITVALLFVYAVVAMILYAILMAVVGFIAPVMVGLLAVVVLALLVILGALIGLYLWSKLIMSLPAAALGIQTFGLNAAWSATRGHVGRLMLTYAGLMLPMLVLSFAVSWIFELVSGGSADVASITEADLTQSILIAIIPNFVISAFSTALVASGMSYTYYRLGQPPEWVEKVF